MLWFLHTPLNEVNILPKFNKNLSKDSEDMEQTKNARLKQVTFNCDLDLGLHGLVMDSTHHLCKGNI